jgi:hypothetical protein
MNSEYNVYDANNEKEPEIPVFTTPEDILLAWEGMQALMKTEKDIPAVGWQEFLSWMTGR